MTLTSRWLLIVLLGLQVHFAASYLVPLDAKSQGEFGGLLRWFWPWSYGDGGPLGQISLAAGFPIAGFWIAMAAAGLLALSLLAVAGWWIPGEWWRPLATVGALLLLSLMALFFGSTKLMPIGAAIGTIYLTLARPTLFETT
jgi:hypothetical protein